MAAYQTLANPASHGESLKRWISQFFDICERISPDDDSELELNQEIGERQIEQLLAIDIRLNAQGILHWWKTTGGRATKD